MVKEELKGKTEDDAELESIFMMIEIDRDLSSERDEL
jgi:hypothetical protein